MFMQQKRFSGGYVHVVALIAAVIVVAVITLIVVNMRRNPATTNAPAVSLSGCVSKTFGSGSSGHCVGDIQTLVNYMENSGLTECPFTGGTQLALSSVYDNPTVLQVQSVQGWAGCYAKQEGFTSNVQQTGTVDKATWGELCTYGYINPSHNGAAGSAKSIAAGKDAGCAQLQQS